ncbi:MAG: penicillin-binding transpeptidase domain-containing protein [Thermomicrobiales bacterium]|nr:penicillin-binding transpeptidase domain-containing protein [Thermomicrobiales bacterium]
MSNAIRTLFLLGAIGLIGFGLFIGDDLSDARWLALLGGAFLCLLLATRIPLSAGMPTFNRGLIRTTMLLACIFILLSAQLIRIQVVRQEEIYYRTGIALDGEVISNPRLYQQQLTVQRGKILDRNGVVLADTTLQDGIYYRSWPVPSTYSVTGYYSPNAYGMTGIEATFEEELSGQAGTNPIEQTIRSLFGREQAGADVEMTIDSDLQTLAYNAMGNNHGAIVLLDIKTGETLVLASKPTVNPNSLYVVSDSTDANAYWDTIANDEANRPFVTRSTMGLYTPGSTFKTVSAGIAINEGIANPDTIYEDNGQITIDGRVLVEQNRPDQSRDQWSLREAIMWSLNVVMAQVGLEIGGDTYWEYGPKLGYDTPIPYDLPVYQSQIASNRAFLDSQNALADTGFGQGQIQMTPLHLAMLASMWANDGTMVRPILVSKVTAADGSVLFQAKPQVWLQCVDPATANDVKDMMIDVIETGSAQHGQAYPYTIGGKTGTAELGDGTTNSLFIGFIGDPEPRYAIAVVLESDPDISAVATARDILVAAMNRRDGD